MRKYTDQFVINRLGSRLNSAACPFPGKYPLRLMIRIGERVLYHGKFHSAIWRQYCNKPPRRNLWVSIYDKAGPVVYGSNMQNLNIVLGPLSYRYFAATWVNGIMLKKVTPELIGTYRVYLNDYDEGMIDRPLNRPRFIHYVNSNIAHIRTI